MEHDIRIITPEYFFKLLEYTDFVPLDITGTSMQPFLEPMRDNVILAKPKKPIRRGQIILYRRNNGALILHRVYRVEPDRLLVLGDGQAKLEPIRPDQVLAVALSACRNEQSLRPGHPIWDFYEKVWIRILPLRPYIRGLMRRINRK